VAELEAARVELAKAHVELMAQKEMLDTQAKELAQSKSVLQEMVGSKATLALQRELYDMQNKIAEILRELQEQRR
jgi:hypothetical protein